MVRPRRQALAWAGAGQHADGEPGTGGMRHLQVVRRVADHGDGSGRHGDGGAEGVHHAGAGLDAMAGIPAADEIEMRRQAEGLHRRLGGGVAVHRGDAEPEAAVAQAAEQRRQVADRLGAGDAVAMEMRIVVERQLGDVVAAAGAGPQLGELAGGAGGQHRGGGEAPGRGIAAADGHQVLDHRRVVAGGVPGDRLVGWRPGREEVEQRAVLVEQHGADGAGHGVAWPAAPSRRPRPAPPALRGRSASACRDKARARPRRRPARPARRAAPAAGAWSGGPRWRRACANRSRP